MADDPPSGRKSDPARKAEFIRPTPLADKVPTMGGPRPEDAIRRAEKAIAAVAGEFEGMLAEELDELDILLRDYRQNPEPQALDRLFRRVHNLRGQGTTLGFPLITRIGTSFCGYLIERDQTKPVKPALIEQHIMALRVVLKERGTPKGNALSDSVAAALEEAVRRELG